MIVTYTEQEIDLVRQDILDGKSPRYLYKYRTIEQALQFLSNHKIYFSDFTEFNDPFESACKYQLEYTPKQFYDAFLRMVKNPILAASKAEQIRLGLIDGQKLLKQSNDAILKGFGYYCMAKRPDNILMWSHYADKHQGVCFKFDLLQDLNAFMITIPVEYNSEYPEFDSLNGNPTPIIRRKSSDWQYEQEYRTIKTKVHGLYEIKKDVLVEIIFGCRISPEDTFKIKAAVLSNGYHNVLLTEAKMKDSSFGLALQPVQTVMV